MSTYELYFTCEASQTITVEADSLDEAMQQAENELELFPNIGNHFDMGDPDILFDASYCDGKQIAPRGESA